MLLALLFLFGSSLAAQPPARVAVRAARLIDPAAGRAVKRIRTNVKYGADLIKVALATTFRVRISTSPEWAL